MLVQIIGVVAILAGFACLFIAQSLNRRGETPEVESPGKYGAPTYVAPIRSKDSPLWFFINVGSYVVIGVTLLSFGIICLNDPLRAVSIFPSFTH